MKRASGKFFEPSRGEGLLGKEDYQEAVEEEVDLQPKKLQFSAQPLELLSLLIIFNSPK